MLLTVFWTPHVPLVANPLEQLNTLPHRGESQRTSERIRIRYCSLA